MKQSILQKRLISFVFSALLLSIVPVISCHAETTASSNQKLQLKTDDSPLERNTKRPAPTSYSDVINKVSPSVVNIFSTKIVEVKQRQLPFFNDPFFRKFFDGPQNRREQKKPEKREKKSLGSGVIITEGGYILTNHHVVKKADEVSVKLATRDQKYEAEIVGSDPQTDLAVLKVNPEDPLQPATLGDSNNVEVGDITFALGNPFGIGKTVTMGIVSAKNRGLNMLDYENFIQTDASINPGNSGGALIDAQGRVVGINTVILSRSGGSQGMGFAIPINIAKSVVKQLVEKGEVSRGFLGVQIQPLTPDKKKYFDTDHGVLINEVIEDMPAQKAGLKPGDVLLSFDGKKIKDLKDLRFSVARTSPGKSVSVTVLRDGEKKTFTLELAEKPSKEKMASGTREDRSFDLMKGVSITSITRRHRKHLNLPKQITGLLVEKVEPGSPASESGLKRGDVIQRINRHPVSSIQDAKQALKKGRDDAVLLYVWRDGSNLFVVIEK